MEQIRWETERRYYAAELYQDSLGDWVVERTWGGLHDNLGNGAQVVVPEYSDAVAAMVRIHKERRYGIVEGVNNFV